MGIFFFFLVLERKGEERGGRGLEESSDLRPGKFTAKNVSSVTNKQGVQIQG